MTIDGIKFDSQREAARWLDLCDLQKRGTISNLKRQVSFPLVPAAIVGGRKKPTVRYVADFVYLDSEKRLVVEDSKGFQDSYFRLKLHLMKYVHDIDIKLT